MNNATAKLIATARLAEAEGHPPCPLCDGRSVELVGRGRSCLGRVESWRCSFCDSQWEAAARPRLVLLARRLAQRFQWRRRR